jgi:acyl-CoA thioester hydrolase
MPPIYRYDLTVTEDMIDANGHVNNVEYVSWMQDAAVRHSEHSGATPAMKAIGAIWVARSHRIEYLKPAFGGDHVSVLTWISGFRRVQYLLKYQVVRLEDDAVLARAESYYLFVDAKSGRLRSIPAEVSVAFDVLPVEKERELLAAFMLR